MSLIHEALKRAEVDKLRRSPYFNNLTVIPPAEDESPPPPRPAEPPPPARASVPTLKILALALVVTAGVGGGFMWKQYRGRAGLPATVAAQEAPAPPALAAAMPKPPAEQPSPAVRTPPPPAPLAGPATPLVPAPRPAAVPVPKAVPARAVATVVDVAPPPPAAPTALAMVGGAGPAPTVSQDPAGAADQSAEASPKADATLKPSATSRTGRATTAKSVATKPKSGTAPTAATAASSRLSGSKQPAAKADAGRYRLSAIGRGPEGSVALINESVVQEGQTVLEAKVIKIGPNYVELETAGTHFTIRL